MIQVLSNRSEVRAKLRRGGLRCLLLALAFLCLFSGTARAADEGGGGGAGGPAGTGGAVGGEGTGGTVAPVKAPKPVNLLPAIKVKPTEVVRGSVVSVTWDRLPPPASVRLWLDDYEIGAPVQSKDGQSWEIVIPDTEVAEEQPRPIVARRYRLAYSEKQAKEDEDTAAPRTSLGVIRIIPEKMPKLTLESVLPNAFSPDDTKLVLMGDGFGGDVRDYALTVDGTELHLCPAPKPECDEGAGESPACCKGLLASFVSDHQLEVTGPFHDFRGRLLRGEHKIGVRAGDASAAGKVVAFSAYSAAWIRWFALGVTAALLVAMVLLVMNGGRAHQIGSKRFVGRAFLIDTETDTYSLSKAQFYLWSGAALLAYVYLTLSRCLVQGKLDIADVPENLPGMLGISAGTAVLSVGVTKFRGPKAAGVMHPSFADLLGAGGVASPERFQLLIWTLVAVFSFILNVWNVDPMVLNDLPSIPANLLALSGVSSAAYLGGKLARGPGPVLDEVLAVDQSRALLLMGRNLGLDATFEVGGQPITEHLDPNQHPERRPIAVKREDGEDGNRFAKSLKVVLESPPDIWAEALKQPEDPAQQFTLTIANRDGQRAEAEIPRAVLLNLWPQNTG
jgi:hypothetical protein